jgi:putative ABC transport system ATP-binding protein
VKAVELRDVSKIYIQGLEEIRAVNNLTWTIPQGQFLAIMGASGSGKSTLLHLMGGLDIPTSGEIILAGLRVSQMTDHQLTLFRRRNLGFIFQFFNLLPTLTAEENIILPLQINGKKVKEHQGYINKIVEMVGLSKRLSHKPRELSGGQMQRVAIARALVHQPAILLADEPTGNLDSKTGEEILSLLREINQQTKVTIIMVTHDPKGFSYGQRLVQMKDGAISEEKINSWDGIPSRANPLHEVENA